VTEWREWDAWRRVTAVSLDAVSSAASVGAEAAAALEQLARSVAAYAPESYPEAVEDAVELLVDRQAVRAPVLALCNEIYLALPGGPEGVVGVSREFAERLTSSTARIGETGADLITDGLTVLVHGASTSVRAVLDAARERSSFQVCCTEAMPGGEGLEMAAELTVAGFDVEVVDDESAVELLPGVDMVVSGADAIGPDAAVSKAGIRRLAVAADLAGVQLYLTAGRDKILPAGLFRITAQLGWRRSLSEIVSLALFTAIVSDIGMLDVDDVAGLAVERTVAPQLAL
jgi:translation initiation factor 2B subunit (eIF-2B alpha/beta/delta family)